MNKSSMLKEIIKRFAEKGLTVNKIAIAGDKTNYCKCGCEIKDGEEICKDCDKEK